ncbi:MAG: hypothetical protein HYX63_04240 [Gammaproteobacteria bacterium]|nr:hypothetical protein [Gammaproteobacteria bacterium]
MQLGLKDTIAEVVNIDVSDGVATERGGTATAAEDRDLTFATAGFAFLADGTPDTLAMQIAGKPNNVAPGAQNFELQAVRTSDKTGACVAALAATQTVDVAYECVSPATCSASAFNVSGSNIAGNPNGAVTSYAPVTLAFNASTGKAPFTALYSDAGSVRLHARYAIPLGAGVSGNFMTGSSNAFIDRPFALAVTVPGNPTASGPSGGRFIAAGATFGATVRAVTWAAADDTNNDGVADGHAAADFNPANNTTLTDNATTPNYQPATPLTLSARLNQPVGGTDPGLTGTTTASIAGGVASPSGLRFDEVGIVELSAAQSGNYLGIGAAETAKIRGNSGYVGRFAPARLTITANVPTFADACPAGVFTYFDQPFFFAQAPQLIVTGVTAGGALN